MTLRAAQLGLALDQWLKAGSMLLLGFGEMSAQHPGEQLGDIGLCLVDAAELGRIAQPRFDLFRLETRIRAR